MPISLKTRTVFHCKCIRPQCGHEWDALTKPKRCAKCKYRSWNGEDHRYIDPYDGVPVSSQIPSGTQAPPSPSHEPLLDTLVAAREVIDQLIVLNPCDHKKHECVCREKGILASLDQQIEKLRALQPRRSTYLARRGQKTAEGR